jgi:hypothetical protein
MKFINWVITENRMSETFNVGSVLLLLEQASIILNIDIPAINTEERPIATLMVLLFNVFDSLPCYRNPI